MPRELQSIGTTKKSLDLSAEIKILNRPTIVRKLVVKLLQRCASEKKKGTVLERDTALQREVNFWESLANGTAKIPQRVERFRRRVAGEWHFPESLQPFLPESCDGLRILDVGSGPHTSIGKPKVDYPVEIVAVDPLAKEYAEMLSRCGLTPAIVTQYGEAESLTDVIEPDSFDIVYAKNSLDHVADPLKSIQQMAIVCRPNGVLFCEGRVNEGVHQNYNQLHQWNLMPCEDDLIIWNREGASSVRKLLGSQCQIEAQWVPMKNEVSSKDWLFRCSIRLAG